MKLGWRSAALMMVLAFALRAWDFGYPVLGLDEQWYLLVGDRMLDGAVPYMDLWDRKPIGLFLLYAAFRLVPGDGIVVYQVAATLSAGLTAAVVVAMVERTGGGSRGGVAAGALYLLTASVIGGQGGQAPVFYNLPVATAALLTLRLPRLIDGHARGAIVWNGIAACALAGLALQLKYTVAFEAAFIGLAHVWALRRAGASWMRATGCALIWCVMGLLPTLAATIYYAALGTAALQAFVFANFVSVTLRQSYPAARVAAKLAAILGQTAPLLLAAVIATWRHRRSTGVAATSQLALWWLAAAVAGFLSLGAFHDHYALPVLPALTVVAGAALGRSRVLTGGVVAAALAIFAVERAAQPRTDEAGVRRIAAMVRSASARGCPYVFMGDPIIYHLAEACIPTPYAFSNTLGQAIEQGSTGIDEAGEVRRIMQARPPIVITTDRARTIWNMRSRRVLDMALARHYRLSLVVPRGRWRTLVYTRRYDAVQARASPEAAAQPRS